MILLIVYDLIDLSLGIDRLLIHRGDLGSDLGWIDTELDQIKIIPYPQLYHLKLKYVGKVILICELFLFYT